MDWLGFMQKIRHIVFGVLFIGVGLYLLLAESFGMVVDFPGGVLNYIFGVIAVLYGIARIWMYKKYC